MSHLEYLILVLVGGIIGTVIRWHEKKSKEIKHSDRTFHPEWKDNEEK